MYFINEGVGPALKYTGLHIVTIQTTDLTFNIHNCYNGKHLLSWDHCNIRRSGRVGPLVFLEVGRRCQGGPGVLWMYYPDHLAGKFRESLQRSVYSLYKLMTAMTGYKNVYYFCLVSTQWHVTFNEPLSLYIHYGKCCKIGNMMS